MLTTHKPTTKIQSFWTQPKPQSKPRTQTMSFLPVGYQAPKSSNNFMKLQDGENKIRILTAPVLGWEDWIDKKPVRFGMDSKPARPYDPKKPIKHFWSFIVFNYNEEQVQILHITQASIRNAIETLCNDKDWGAPYFYDIKIMKKGEQMDTEYNVIALPHKPVDPYIVEQFKEKPCNLDAVFTGEDPFDKEHRTHTPGVFGELPVDWIIDDKITAEQALELQNIMAQCDEAYRTKVYDFLRKNHNVKDLTEMSPDVYNRVYTAALKKAESMNVVAEEALL